MLNSLDTMVVEAEIKPSVIVAEVDDPNITMVGEIPTAISVPLHRIPSLGIRIKDLVPPARFATSLDTLQLTAINAWITRFRDGILQQSLLPWPPQLHLNLTKLPGSPTPELPITSPLTFTISLTTKLTQIHNLSQLEMVISFLFPTSVILNSKLLLTFLIFAKFYVFPPCMKSNLLSVQRFCRDNFCSFTFDAHRFQIQDLTGKPLYKGISKDGLYPIRGLSLPSWHSRRSSASSPSSSVFPNSASHVSSKACPPAACFNVSSKACPPAASSNISFKACPPAACHNVSQTNLWHMRLGHPQTRVLQQILRHHISDKFSVSDTFCKHCVMGKMTQLPFSTSTSCTQFPLQLVHSDVWGPAPINSINSHRYYVIFLDDFTRFTWFFPLKHKSQVLASFQHFKNTMENHLGTSIKTLWTDCGGEYTNNEFRIFCSKSSIFHQFTCPHTSQQNGVAERKHRHIVDTALTLISHSSIPFKYWPYVFSTAIFLINRLPSLSRGSISP